MEKNLNIYEAAIFLKMSPTLIKWLISYSPKYGEKRKLNYEKTKEEEYYFSKDELTKFNKYLLLPWPSQKGDQRPYLPSGIKDEIKSESAYRCVICGQNLGEIAHIDSVNNSKNNHPHNLIYLCPNCHTLYDNNQVIRKNQLKKIKVELLQSKVIIWKSYTNLLDEITSLITELKRVESNTILNDTSKQNVIKNILLTLKEHTEENFKSPYNIEKDKSTIKKYKNNIHQIFIDNIDVNIKLFEEKESFLIENKQKQCPICVGSGIHNNCECPVCRGTGTVDERDIDDIDLALFEQVDCPLCNGSGSHNNWECPVCKGIGTVDKSDIDEIDLALFEQVDCPLCNGSGRHNNWECPVCKGIGTVDKSDIDEIDLALFEQSECPLCNGSGRHNNWECPVCKGIGTVDKSDIDEIDLALFEQSECPLCNGSGRHNNWECPVCKGIGTVDKSDIDEIDLALFEQSECPLCNGSGSHNNWECPVCKGIGTVDKSDIDEIDLALFEQSECPLCKGSGIHNNWECPVCKGIGTVDERDIDDILNSM